MLQDVDGGVDDVLADLGNGAVGTHAAGVGAFVVVVGALVVLGDGHGPEFGAADEAHEGEFLAFEEVFDDDLGAGLAEAVVDEDVVESGDGGVDVHGDGDTLAGGESVGLDDDGGAVFAHVGDGVFEVVEGAVLGGGDVVAGHQLLGEVFGAFDLGGGLVGAEGLDAGRGEVVDESFDQGDFRADERPVVLVVLHEADEGGVV